MVKVNSISKNLSDSSSLESNVSDLLTKALFLAEENHLAEINVMKGKNTVSILADLKLGTETAIAGFITASMLHSLLSDEILIQEFGENIFKLIKNVKQMNILPALRQNQIQSQLQIDKIRKMLLSMATDIRGVIIKLSERLCTMRTIKSLELTEQQSIAKEVLDIYAPLANRLGIGQIKWELEDLAFRTLDPQQYKTIAKFLAEKRTDREHRVDELIQALYNKLQGIDSIKIMGRAKHIYSIHAKTKRKQLNYDDLYDSIAVRILTTNIQECYTALSIVHNIWNPIIEEFDDYIAHPKPNGYRSIHTAVMDNDRCFEIQIRTFDMHEEAERGVAAHWLYKENSVAAKSDTTKMAYLRQLLDWHQEIAIEDQTKYLPKPGLDDQIYVITPAGDILDLPIGATPLDFAYRIHTELGHRCRGAKVNGKIVPLNSSLRTGDKVEIHTLLQATPSRDWLNPILGYIKTSHAKQKIAHWFKQQIFSNDVASGKQLLEREFTRAGIAKSTSIPALAKQFHVKNEDFFYAAVWRGQIKVSKIIQILQPRKSETFIAQSLQEENEQLKNASLADSATLLTRFAKCCKPIPGDAIMGYITQGRGISIHKLNCSNMPALKDNERLIPITWNAVDHATFNTDLTIISDDNKKILNELTALFIKEDTQLTRFHSNTSKNTDQIVISVTIRVTNISHLQKIISHIQQLPGVIEVKRVK